MALNATVLKGLIKAEVALANTALADADVDLDWLCEAIAKAVVTHIQTSGVVVVTSVSGVTTGPGVSGPGTGTIT